MKTTLDLPDELIREVKLRAVVQGRTLRDVVAEFLRQGLGIETDRPAKSFPEDSLVSVGGEGLPVVRCASGAPASKMSVKELLRLEQDTQLQEDSRRARKSF